MLTKESMLRGWTLLHERFGNKASDSILAIYFKFLRDKLTDQEWAIAVERSILEESFFPSAKLLIEKVKPSDQSLAASAWETIIASAKQGQPPDLDPNAECALLRIGGRTAIESSPEDKLPFLKKDFAREYSLVVAQQTREALPCNQQLRQSSDKSKSLNSANRPQTKNHSLSPLGNVSVAKTQG
jgi:hypothetical protein